MHVDDSPSHNSPLQQPFSKQLAPLCAQLCCFNESSDRSVVSAEQALPTSKMPPKTHLHASSMRCRRMTTPPVAGVLPSTAPWVGPEKPRLPQRFTASAELSPDILVDMH